ncbi:MAG TPA: hypothetical protein VGN52_13390 [Burkholderiales bacterium]
MRGARAALAALAACLAAAVAALFLWPPSARESTGAVIFVVLGAIAPGQALNFATGFFLAVLRERVGGRYAQPDKRLRALDWIDPDFLRRVYRFKPADRAERDYKALFIVAHVSTLAGLVVSMALAARFG